MEEGVEASRRSKTDYPMEEDEVGHESAENAMANQTLRPTAARERDSERAGSAEGSTPVEGTKATTAAVNSEPASETVAEGAHKESAPRRPVA